MILCASELAANAAVHSRSRLPGGTFTVRATVSPGLHARVEVEDNGGAWNQGMIDPATWKYGPAFDPPPGDQGWDARRLEALARSMLDGLAVWSRELTRAQNERSASVLEHEAERARRMAELWEAQIDHPLMRGALNMAQITLACGLGMEARNPHLHWRPRHPKLCDWYEPIAARPSFAATAPPRAAWKS